MHHPLFRISTSARPVEQHAPPGDVSLFSALPRSYSLVPFDPPSIAMIASFSGTADLGKDQDRAIATLAEKLHLPAQEVQQVYLQEFDRLESQARIRGFLGVLALRNARSLLCSGNSVAPDG